MLIREASQSHVVVAFSFGDEMGLLCSVGSGVVVAGSARFHSEASASVNIIIRTANEASQTLYNTTGALRNIQTNLDGSSVGDAASDILNSASHKLGTESAIIETQASKHRRLIHKGLKLVYDCDYDYLLLFRSHIL